MLNFSEVSAKLTEGMQDKRVIKTRPNDNYSGNVVSQMALDNMSGASTVEKGLVAGAWLDRPERLDIGMLMMEVDTSVSDYKGMGITIPEDSVTRAKAALVMGFATTYPASLFPGEPTGTKGSSPAVVPAPAG